MIPGPERDANVVGPAVPAEPVRPERLPRLLRSFAYLPILALLGVVGLPLLLIILVVSAPLVVCALAMTSLACHRFSRGLRAQRRVIRRSDVWDQLLTGRGTLILESFTLGWGATRLWWTEEGVLAMSPEPPETFDDERDRVEREYRHPSPFTVWCHDRYLDSDRGSARLVRSWGGIRLRDRLIAEIPDVPVVEIWSAPLFVRRHTKEFMVDDRDLQEL